MRRAPTQIRVARTTREVEALAPAWRRLHTESGDRNPFANPDFQLAWLDHAPARLRPFVVHAAGDDGLDWIAPLHLAPIGPMGLLGTCLMPFAAHGDEWLVEQAPILSRIDPTDTVQQLVNAVLDHAGEWTWVELTLSPAQGWLATTDDSRFPELGRRRVLHKEVRASTVMPLRGTWEETRAGLKRNIRNSMATARSRARKSYGDVEYALASKSGDPAAFARRLVALNLQRADTSSHVEHATPFHDARSVELFVDTVAAVVSSGNGDVLELRDPQGRALGSLFTPYGDGATFISLSGFDPQAWRISPPTLLTVHAIERAIELGHDRITFSPGPHVSKSRWSAELEHAQTFLLAGEGRLDRVRFLGYWLTRAVLRWVDEGRLIRG